MAKVRKITSARIKKLPGGKNPISIIEEFLVKRGFNPDECLQQRTSEIATWSVPLTEDEELEITLEGLNRPTESTLYMGVNILSVPIRNCQQTLAVALTVADTLIGAKLSLVNYDLVLSATQYTSDMGVDDVDYFFELIFRQKAIIRETIAEESNH